MRPSGNPGQGPPQGPPPGGKQPYQPEVTSSEKKDYSTAILDAKKAPNKLVV